MRYAVISDIHSNLEAFSAFIDEVENLDINKIICLGDIVGYNANPNECIDIIRKKKIICVMGNHDSRASGLEDPFDFNLQAQTAIYWTRHALNAENKEFLRNLPRTLLIDNKFLAVHGSIDDTDTYILGERSALRNFDLLREMGRPNLCFFGHTHVPVTFAEHDGSADIKTDQTIKIEKGVNYLINPGSIGQPRDRDPRASFIIYDTRKSIVTFHRIEYDIQSTAEKILAAGLPERLAERLKLGW
ncbi:MAG: metallophosphoesterase family protein [Deltaproteobacteria bacterium]|nr:metallophosphoesterase family protein [Deltaproteobacteria bacterium]